MSLSPSNQQSELGMDENARRRKQHEEQPYAAPDPRIISDNQGRNIPGSSSERYRSTPMNTSSPTTRGVPPGSAAYPSYYQVNPPSFSTNMQYQPTTGYGQDHRQQAQSGFASYSSEIMYNVPQQGPHTNAYNPATQYHTRPSPAMQLVPDVSAPYFSGESTSAPEAPNMQHHSTSNSDSNVYPQHQHHPSPGERASLLQHNYSSLAMSGISQAPEVAEEQLSAPGPGIEADYTAYQTALKEIFQNIINGRLIDASQSLLDISEWLLGHVADLGELSNYFHPFSANYLRTYSGRGKSSQRTNSTVGGI